ncbi:lipoprotein [Mycoplasma feriruminatoris]|uniref:Lipoprotein n=1 Tax=Mycoplasma feriruminatoris TaxID=1179777 RepID=A0A654INA1_9MOLU|nr:hypothetical protein MF5583_00546 [Mycoplasma feriruminatoris]
MKKLLTLLGSVAIVGSSAAVAVACENRPFTFKASGEVKPQSQPQGDEVMLGDQPGAGEVSKEELIKELEKKKKI